MRSINTCMYEVEGDKGDEKHTGPMLGIITYYPNEQIHDQSQRILREINMALRVDPDTNTLKDDPPQDWDKIKLIRYTSDWILYEVTRYEAFKDFDPHIGDIKGEHPIKQRYILMKS